MSKRSPASGLRIGVCLPNFRIGATREGIDAAVETAARLGWHSVWSTDHVLPDSTPASQDYFTIFEALSTLAYAAGRTSLALGTSVLVAPMRNAAVVAKEVATIDALSGGRLTLGVGVGWCETEYANLGEADRFHRRGAYLDESIALWRHLWSGSQEPFHGTFHSFDDYRFGPLPAQGADLPIWVGGRSDAALRRAGGLADGYHATRTAPADYVERMPAVRAAAQAAGRPEPTFSTRAQVRSDDTPRPAYSMHGTPDEMAADLDAYAAAGVSLIVLDFMEVEPDRVASAMERFDRGVLPLHQRR